MDINTLTERLKYSLRKKEVQQLANFFSEHPEGIDILWDLTNTDEKDLSFHAAWVLECCFSGNRLLLNAYAERLLTLIPHLQNNSVKRHFCKLFKTWMAYSDTDLKGWLDSRNDKVEQLIAVCYDWLLSAKVPIAVKVHCLDILSLLAEYYSWIAEELPHTMRLAQIDSAPAVKAVIRRVAKRMAGHGKA